MTKCINELVVQLAYERERLHNQIYLLTRDKKARQNYLPKSQKKNPCTGDDRKEPSKASAELDITSTESKTEVTDISSTNSEEMKSSRDVSENEVRNIDARQMNFKYLLFPFVILLIYAGIAFWLEYQSERT